MDKPCHVKTAEEQREYEERQKKKRNGNSRNSGALPKLINFVTIRLSTSSKLATTWTFLLKKLSSRGNPWRRRLLRNPPLPTTATTKRILLPLIESNKTFHTPICRRSGFATASLAIHFRKAGWQVSFGQQTRHWADFLRAFNILCLRSRHPNVFSKLDVIEILGNVLKLRVLQTPSEAAVSAWRSWHILVKQDEPLLSQEWYAFVGSSVSRTPTLNRNPQMAYAVTHGEI